ncbi:hypothetical protein GQ55_2G441600 [Panicum hallii var. hallii]|uniref:Uncharacterized protein n=1 Tax=Panicum hallii var. hallii TaxID=1504633 RepID=A0A2T7EYW7_9POAL|nr:hypothetical protein GQ55_2G441500 [Panicum hallii var. hallii]PUZ73019.1 hypothetical protein GQ55_2G441600 [Panicum hallii var. hallii]
MAERLKEIRIAAAAAAATAAAVGATGQEAAAAGQAAAEGVGAAGADAAVSVRAAAVAQRVREEFSFAAAQTNSVLNPPLVIMLLLYPSMMGFTITKRYTKYSLLIPTPNIPGVPPPPSALGGPQDEWLTVSPRALWCTTLSFTVVVAIHLFLVVHLTLTGPPGSPAMAGAIAWIAPVVFWFSTSTYFVMYTSLARYGVATIEWVIAGTCSGALLLVTLMLIYRANSLSLSKVVGQRPGAPV